MKFIGIWSENMDDFISQFPINGNIVSKPSKEIHKDKKR